MIRLIVVGTPTEIEQEVLDAAIGDSITLTATISDQLSPMSLAVEATDVETAAEEEAETTEEETPGAPTEEGPAVVRSAVSAMRANRSRVIPPRMA